MPPNKWNRPWFKLYAHPWINGSIRSELTSAERSVWLDFLALATSNRPPGCISFNETTAMPVRRIAALLNISVALVKRSMDKFTTQGRITVDDAGIIHLTNWAAYQFSDYDRQKVYRQQALPGAESEPEPDAGEIPF